MAPSGWIEILANVGVCAIVVALSAELSNRPLRLGPRAGAALLGLVMGGGAVAGMLVPYQVAPGVFFDLRGAMVALAAFVGGPIAGLVATVPPVGYRAYTGGVGAVAGCVALVAAVVFGWLGHRLLRGRPPGPRDLTALGVGVALASLFSSLLLPPAVWMPMALHFWPTLFAATAGAVIVLGAVLTMVQHRDAEAATNRLYRAMVEALPDSLHVKDLEGRFIAANAATARLVGIGAPQALIGRTDGDFYPPELALRYRTDEVAFMAGDSPLLIDQPSVAADGAERWLSTLIAPFHGPQGRLAGIVTHHRDITERKQLEVELTTANKRLDDALESMADAFALYDAEDRLVLCNRHCRELFARTADLHVPGIHLADLVRAKIKRGEFKGISCDDAADWLARYSPRLHPNGRYEMELADGRWVEKSARPTHGDGRIVLYRDITERKLNEIALAEARDAATVADRAKSEFLAVMSHEIRTPLTAVIGIADILGDRELDTRSKYYVGVIRRSGNQLLAIVNDVLDFLRLGAGRLTLQQIDFSLESLLEEVRSTFSPLASESGVELHVAVAGAEVRQLRGDPMRLRQVLFNFVSNAIKFTDHGRVRVHASVEAQKDGHCRLRIEVVDTGIGIPAEQLPRLFQTFTQVDSTASQRFNGAGLGLAICKQLIEKMAGQIGCESRLGEGSRFWFDVSLERGLNLIEVRDAASEIPLPALSILLAEDAPLNRELFIDVLQRRGHDVTFAENGVEFLEKAKLRMFDALIVDIQMPLMGGEEAIRRLRSKEGCNWRTPALALTANVLTHDRDHYIDVGFDAVLHKPVVWADLFSELGRLVGQGREARSTVESPCQVGESS